MKLSKLKTRVLSLIMSAVMLIGMVPDLGLAAYAADTDDVAVSDEAAADETEEAAPAGEEVPEEEIAEAGVAYDLWVGGVQVTEANKDDIPGVTSGKASFDPATNTLTLTGVKGFKGIYESGPVTRAYIYSIVGEPYQGLTLKGDATINSMAENDIGIYAQNGLESYADLTMKGNGRIGIFCGENGFLNIWGGNINIQTTDTENLSYGIWAMGALDIKDATIKTAGARRGIVSNGYLSFNNSTVYAAGERQGICCDENYNTATPLGLSVLKGSSVTAIATGNGADPHTTGDGYYTGIASQTTLTVDTDSEVYAQGEIYGVFANKNITVEGGGSLEAVCSATTTKSSTGRTYYTAVLSKYGSIYIGDGWVHANGKRASLLTIADNSKITLENGAKILDPADNVRVDNHSSDYLFGSKNGQSIYYKSAYNPVPEVTIGVSAKPEPESYSLYVGKIEVNSNNKNSIPVKSGFAYYEPSTHTLTFEDAVVETYYGEGIDMSQAILAESDLTIKGKVTIKKVDNSGYGIIMHGNNTLNLEDLELTAVGMTYEAIRVAGGSLVIKNSKVYVTTTGDDGTTAAMAAIHAKADITLDKAYIMASAKNNAIYADGQIKGTESHEIDSPDGAEFGEKTVLKGGNAVTAATIIPKMDDVLWIGGTRVDYLNKDDILEDGKVSYDPDTKTLKFNDLGAVKNYGQPADLEGKKTAIYTKIDNLVISGKVSINTVPYPDYAIYSTGNITFSNADLDLHAANTALNAKNVTLISGALTLSGIDTVKVTELTLDGGKTTVKASATAIDVAKLTINKGELTVDVVGSGATGITVGSAMVVNDGNVKITATDDVNQDYSDGVYGKDATIKILGGTFSSYADNCAVYAGKGITVGSEMTVTDPDGVKLKDDGKTFVQDNGTTANYVVIKSDVTKYTVSFNMMGRGGSVSSQLIISGKKAQKPTDPTAEGYTFGGWFREEEYTHEYNFDTPVTADITLYAKWTKNDPDAVEYTVSFNMMGHGDSVSSQKVVSGNKAQKPEDPTAEGYVFGGWYSDEACTVEYSFDTAVTADITLYAKWTANEGPSPIGGGRSALDKLPEMTGTTTELYLVKGQSFYIGEGWYIEKSDKVSKKVASISKKGVFKAKKDGVAIIKAEGKNDITVYVSKIAVTTKKIKLNVGQTDNNKIKLSGYDEDHMNILFYSASPDVATVDASGEVTAVAKGTAKISVFINGMEYKCTVTVKEPETAKNRTMHVNVGSSKPISVKGIKNWISADTDIAEMNKNGKKVSAKKAGATVLSASANGVDYTIDFYADDITMSGEKLQAGKSNKYTLNLSVGEETDIIYGEIYQDVVFKTSKGDVAFIDEDGHVVARSKGKSKFTTKINGKTITINVTVQ